MSGSKMREQDMGGSKMWVGARCGWEQDVGESKMLWVGARCYEWKQDVSGSKLWVGLLIIPCHGF